MILMYHKVDIHSPSIWWVNVDDFYRQMHSLQNKNVVYLDDYDCNNPNHVVITFDGIYNNVLKYAAPILVKFGYPFELFITSDYIGKRNEFDVTEPIAEFTTLKELKELEKLGGRIQWHTRSHPDMKQLMNIEKILYELTIPQELSDYFSKDSFKWFAYPYGRFNDLTITETKKIFKGAVSCVEGNNYDKYKFNRLTVTNTTNLLDFKISCIIASYNYGSFLPEAIESVILQTIPADEVIIIDDASEDNTQEVAEYYCEKYPQIKYYRNEINLGITNNFNNAVSLAEGDYIVFLGADNRFQSNYFEECLNVLLKNPTTSIVYTNFALFGTRSKVVYNSFIESYKGEIINDYYFTINFPEFSSHTEAYNEIMNRNFIHGSSMYNKQAFTNIGGYLKRDQQPEDFNLFQRMLKNGYLCKKASNTFLEYRQHSKDQANIKIEIEKKYEFYYNKSISLEKKIAKLEKEIEKLKYGFPYNKLKYFSLVNKYVKKTIFLLRKRGLIVTLKKIYHILYNHISK